MNRDKRENFVRIAEYRVHKALQTINTIERLAREQFYEYTEKDVAAIKKILLEKVDEMERVLLTHGKRFKL